MHTNRNTLFGIIGVLVVLALFGWFVWPHAASAPSSDDGITWHNASADLITLDLIHPGVTVLPQFTVSGKARGTWYFEASFPVEILDKDGNRLVALPAEAQGEWMTEDFVPFEAEVDLGTYSGPATLVLHKDNPSGDPSRDASMSLPIVVQ